MYSLGEKFLIPTLLFGWESFEGLNYVSKNKLTVTYNNIVRYIFGHRRYSSMQHFSYKVYDIGKPFKISYANFSTQDFYLREPNSVYTSLQFSRTNTGYRINAVGYRKQVSRRHSLMLFVRGTNFRQKFNWKTMQYNLRHQFQHTFLKNSPFNWIQFKTNKD